MSAHPAATHDALALLRQRQRAVLALLKGREPDARAMATDAWLQQVAVSPRLAVLQDIDIFWKEHSFLGRCPFTAGVLKGRGWLRAEVQTLIREQALSPFMEELARAFLQRETTHPDPLVATLAHFELALSRAAWGEAGEWTLGWTQEPYALLGRLLADELPDYEAGPARWVTVVRADLPQLFEVRPAPAAGAGTGITLTPA
jgi:hypothetical protein